MAIALVTGQHVKTAASGGTSLGSQTLPSSVTANNLLVLVQTLWMTGGTISSVTDTQGNTWTAATTLANADSIGISGVPRVQIWYAIAGSTGSNTVTANFSGTATYSTGVLMEFSGCATASPQDGSGVAVSNGNVNTGATPTILSTSLTTGQANSLLVAGIVCNNDIVAGSGFTAPESSASWAYDRAEYKLDAGSAGSQTIAFNETVGNNDVYALVGAAFKISGGGGGGATRNSLMLMGYGD